MQETKSYIIEYNYKIENQPNQQFFVFICDIWYEYRQGSNNLTNKTTTMDNSQWTFHWLGVINLFKECRK